ncbi:MAG: hypothetical protein VX119_00805 [Bacteroidota bacterium]|nr:hypothetical protein [Bacteroidota bacterium]MEC9222112.1 hypothetical protein [Bacteroidota bacterium]
MENSYPLLKKIIRRERYFKLLFALVLLFILGACIGYVFQRQPIALFLLLFLVSSLITWRLKTSFRIDRHPVWRLLVSQAHQVSWIYFEEVQLQPFGILLAKKAVLCIWTIGRVQERIHLPLKYKERLYKELSDMLPEVSFGYSEEKKLWYEAHPSMLRRK